MTRDSSDVEHLEVKRRSELRAWLSKNTLRNTGVWLVTYKKKTSYYFPYSEIVDELICFGWIDSLPRKYDNERTMLYISPRKQRSNWSRINKQKVERLIADGLMADAGLRAIAAAQADGSWDALNAIEDGAPTADLAAALSENPNASAHFAAFPRSVRRGILEWIISAKTPETRDRRVRETVQKAALNIRAQFDRPPRR